MWKKIKSFLFENKTAKQTIAKNTVWLSISSIGGRIIKAVIIIYGARVLGAAGYGVFSYAVTLAGFFTLFADPGISSILVREGAKATPEERQSLFSTTLIMKIVLMMASVAIIVLVAPFFSTLPGAKALLPFVSLIIVFDGMRGFFSALFDAEEKMQWDAAAFLTTNLGVAVFGFIFLAVSATPLSFSIAYVAGTASGALLATWLLRKRFRAILSGVSLQRMTAILKTAWPFAIAGALGILLTNTDILIISWMRTAAEVGIYAAAIRIIQVLYIIPSIIQSSTLPVLARLAKRDPLKFRFVFERIVAFIFLAAIPLSLGGAILGGGIMRLVFGAGYVAGSLAFSILMLTLSFDYAGGIIASGIFAHDHQKHLIVSAAIGGAGNVLFDLLFIPHWGIAGSAVATLIAQILSNGYLWYAMRRINPFHVLPRIRRPIIAGVLMGGATLLLAVAGTNLILNIVISSILYFATLYLMKEPLLAEMKKIITGEMATA
jgi:O-antigen/teichoic acid export membrane protein